MQACLQGTSKRHIARCGDSGVRDDFPRLRTRSRSSLRSQVIILRCMSTLAMNGGKKAIPDGLIKGWPLITDTDRKFVLDSLNQWNHAFGPNCTAFEKEFAAWNGNRFAITTNSGTAALHMGVAAC